MYFTRETLFTHRKCKNNRITHLRISLLGKERERHELWNRREIVRLLGSTENIAQSDDRFNCCLCRECLSIRWHFIEERTSETNWIFISFSFTFVLVNSNIWMSQRHIQFCIIGLQSICQKFLSCVHIWLNCMSFVICSGWIYSNNQVKFRVSDGISGTNSNFNTWRS